MVTGLDHDECWMACDSPESSFAKQARIQRRSQRLCSVRRPHNLIAVAVTSRRPRLLPCACRVPSVPARYTPLRETPVHLTQP